MNHVANMIRKPKQTSDNKNVQNIENDNNIDEERVENVENYRTEYSTIHR